MYKYSLGLLDRTAFITGSSRGLGYAYAKALAAHGCNIVLSDRFDLDDEISFKKNFLTKEFAVKSLYIKADMTKPDEIRTAIGQAAEFNGSLDILINNAGL
jgi:3-hydroxybutyrate dehydrogenase